MIKILNLKIPNKFFKNKSFYIDEKYLRIFLESMLGFVDETNEIYIQDDIDIEKTIEMHSGDCRIWLKEGKYIVPNFKFVFMIINTDITKLYYLIEDIYDWMKYYIPNLYNQHVNFDKESENKK